MKTIKVLSVAIMVLLAILATAGKPAGRPSGECKGKTEVKTNEDGCGVGSDQITSYLQNCSHHHTTYWIQYIQSSCDVKVGIENGNVATVYIDGGTIIGHSEVSGISSPDATNNNGTPGQ